MARIPEDEIERLKREVSVERLAEARGITQAARGGPARVVSVPRGPRAVSRDHPAQEPLALPGRLPGGRLGDRLGDARRGVSFRHAVELLRDDHLPSGCAGENRREAATVTEAAGADRARCRRPRVLLAGGRVTTTRR